MDTACVALGINDNANEIKDLIFKMLKHNEANLKEEFQLQGLLYQFFSLLIKDSTVANKCISKEITTKNIYIRQAINFIKNNYSKGIMVNDIAKHLSESLILLLAEYAIILPQFINIV